MEKDTPIPCRLFLMLAVLFALWAGPSCAQSYQRTIHGIVVDEHEQPLPAAHVKEVPTTPGASVAGVITDVQGHFTLTLPASAKAIEVSFLGYEIQQVALTDATDYEIALVPFQRTAG